MTRLAILADLHANLPALEAVQRDLAQFSLDHVVVAGDIINWGPYSQAVVQRVLEAGWAVIRGNSEFYLLDYQTPRAPAAWNNVQDYAMLGWLQQQLDSPTRRLVAAWPDSLTLRFADAPPVLVVHGSPRSNTEPLYPTCTGQELSAALAGVGEPTIVAAHTHLPMQRAIGRWQLLNPGSVGVPLDGLHRARYMLLEGGPDGWRPAFRDVPIDPAPVVREFERQGFVEVCGLVGQLVLDEYRTARLQVHPFMLWRQACRPGQPLTPDLLAEFSSVDPWAYTPLAYHLNRE